MLEVEDAIDKLELSLQRLKIDFERFFSGNLKAPPEQLRQNINFQIHSLRSRYIRSFALRFRLNNLEARFNTFSVLFGRRLRELEQGSGRQPAGAKSRADARAGIVLGEKQEPGAVEALYQELCRAQRIEPENLEHFRTYLGKQVETIRSKTGCSEVQFRISSKDGKVKLKAKPIESA
jgi:hypothetical protein